MCMADIQIGRKIYGKVTQFRKPRPSGIAFLFIPASPDRVALVISPLSDRNLWVTNDPSVIADHGILISQTTGPLYLDIRTHGSVVREAWWGNDNLNLGGTWTYIDSYLCEDRQ